MNEFLHIGFDSFVNLAHIKVIMAGDAPKLRRELQRRNIDKNSKEFCDATCGTPVKSFILMDDGSIVASAINSQTLIKRLQNKNTMEGINE